MKKKEEEEENLIIAGFPEEYIEKMPENERFWMAQIHNQQLQLQQENKKLNKYKKMWEELEEYMGELQKEHCYPLYPENHMVLIGIINHLCEKMKELEGDE